MLGKPISTELRPKLTQLVKLEAYRFEKLVKLAKFQNLTLRYKIRRIHWKWVTRKFTCFWSLCTFVSICTLLRSRETWAISERCTVQFPPVQRCRLETDGVEAWAVESAAAKVVNFQQDNDLCLWRFSLAHSRIAHKLFFPLVKNSSEHKRILPEKTGKKYSTYFCAKIRKLVTDSNLPSNFCFDFQLLRNCK